MPPRLRRSVAGLAGAIPVMLLLAVLGSGALAESPQQVSLTADEFRFTPSSATITVGQPVQLTIANTGKLAHDLKSSVPITNLTYQKTDMPPDEQADNAAKGILDVDFDPGSTAQVTFIPTTAGSYEFYCDVKGHKEAGMKGTLTVLASPAAAVEATAVPAATAYVAAVATPVAGQQARTGVSASLPKAGDPISRWLPWIGAAALLVVAAGLGVRVVGRGR